MEYAALIIIAFISIIILFILTMLIMFDKICDEELESMIDEYKE